MIKFNIKEYFTMMMGMLRGEGKALLVLQVGGDQASSAYSERIKKDCVSIGAKCDIINMEGSYSTEEIVDFIKDNHWGYDGVIVQHPLPHGIDSGKVFNAIPWYKDIDGLGDLSIYHPCTAAGIYSLLDKVCNLHGANVIIVGRGKTVGYPLAKMLIEGTYATVTVCNSATKELKKKVRESDVVVCATNQAGLISADTVKPGAVVIDAGWPSNVAEDVENVYKPGMMTRLILMMNLCNTKKDDGEN